MQDDVEEEETDGKWKKKLHDENTPVSFGAQIYYDVPY
jgi:hypothetical protein